MDELRAGLGVLAVLEDAPDGAHAAADDRARLEHLHVETGLTQLGGRDEAGEPGADHDHAPTAPREGGGGPQGEGSASCCDQELTAIHGGID